MIEVDDNLFVGDVNDCFYENKEEWVVVHACKYPCHKVAVNYRGNLHRSHPNYLFLEKGNHLFLNMVDMDKPLSHEYTEPIITATLNFIAKHIDSKKVLIHCNIGLIIGEEHLP